MLGPIARLAAHGAYGATQAPRIAWYLGHGAAMRRLATIARRLTAAPPAPKARTGRPVPTQRQLFADMLDLWRRDAANVAAGLYPLPDDRPFSVRDLLDRSRLFFADLPAIHARRLQGGHSEVLDEASRSRRPRYYLQNFHFQTGGWMTDRSARLYDTQVEVTFRGTARAMRRQALPALREGFAGREQGSLRLLDVGSGTGTFLDQVKQVWPRLHVLCVDLSEAYGQEARRQLAGRSRAAVLVAKGEALPVGTASQDAVTSVFLFHELPPAIRRRVIAEIARVLRPGGRFVLVDSIQTGDVPAYDGMLELFPQNFHEPYYASYIAEDFTEIAEGYGLRAVRTERAFMSKIMVFERHPARA